MENQELIAKAVNYAKKNATNSEISVHEIATNAGFSIDYFNRIFLSHTGFTVMAYVSYIRLMKATALLRNTDKSLLDIALEVGYESHEGFIKAFKKKYTLTPSQYRNKMKNKIMSWGELTDKSFAVRFIHNNPDFGIVDSDFVIDYLLEKDAKRYGYFCTTIKNMGLEIVAPNGNLDSGFIGIGDDRKGGYYLELVTDNLNLLSEWIKRFSTNISFYSIQNPTQIKEHLEKSGISYSIVATPQSLYFGDSANHDLPHTLQIRPLAFSDAEKILKWSSGKQDGYINHLLNENHYQDPSFLEYGVFESEDLIAVAGCRIDEIRGLRLNNCCQIRFADGKATDELYQKIFLFVVNDIINKGILPFDDLQHGQYAQTHGKFTSVDLGFEIINWKYDLIKL